MEGNTSWVSNYCYNTSFDNKDCETFPEVEDEENEPMVSVDSILPDELIERILACLPIASIFRAGSVCKRWHDVVSSKRFLWHFLNSVSQKPWYFMFTSTDDPVGYSYDPTLRKWYSLELPRIVTSSWFIASSFGLVCFMNNDNQTGLHIYNPITRSLKRLIEPPGVKFSDYNALAMSVDRVSHRYTISVVRSKQVPENFFQWDLSIHVYDSKTLTWVTSLSEVLNGWRAGDESVICNGFLYFLIYSAGGGIPDSRHGLIRYDLSSNPTRGLLIRNVIPVPCPLTCGRLMNLKEMLVMVGGIGKQYRTDIIKGIAIWVLKGTEWKEIARMPHRFFQGFGELDDVFASSGTEDMIYIQSYGAPALLVFDMNSKQWKWSQKCPVTKRFPLQLFTGFCFEPRLEICP